MTPKAKHRSGGFSQTDLLLAIVVIGLVVALALPGFVKSKDKAMEAEVKMNLNSIQISLERYATDNGGTYPAFALGGSARSWNCLDKPMCLGRPTSDALLRYGFVSSYPANPFAREVADICQWTKGDPRFGCLGSAPGQAASLVMGNTLSDPNFATPDTAANPGTLGPEGFPYYFLGDGDPTTNDWLPGTFVYRTFGVEMDAEAWAERCSSNWPLPACATNVLPERLFSYYFLVGYGSWRTPGKDYLHCYDPHDPAGGFGSLLGEVRCEPEGYDPWVLLAQEPALGTGDVDGDGDTDEIPNVVFQEYHSGYAIGADFGPSNADGQVDGLLIFFYAH